MTDNKDIANETLAGHGLQQAVPEYTNNSIPKIDDTKPLVNTATKGCPTSLLEHALAYAAIGFHVFPLAGKSPFAGSHGFNDATTDEDTIRQWWSKTPSANIGIASGEVSGIFVVDIDPRNGGLVSFKNLNTPLKGATGKLVTPVVMSGNKGLHVYYESKTAIRSRCFEEFPGIDFLGDKKYVVAPPSIHPDTSNRYTWREGCSALDLSLAPIPERLIQLVEGNTDGSSKSVHAPNSTEPLQGFCQGFRQNGLRDYAWRLSKQGLNEKEVTLLVCSRAELCSPPFEKDKAIGLVLSAFAKNRSYVLETISAKELCDKELLPPKFTIEGLLPEGVVLFSASPKKGKSTLARNMAVSVAEGLLFAGRFLSDKGQVLYLSLEEGERAFQSYLKKMGMKPSNLSISFSCPTGNSSVTAINNWLESAENPRLVVIDLLQRVRSERKSTESLYGHDTNSMFLFRELTNKFPGLTILVIHHNRKTPGIDHQDMISGSTGLAGSTDCNMTLERNRGDRYAILVGTGRLIGEFRHVFEYDEDTQLLLWKNSEEFLLTERRRQAIDLLREVYPDSMKVSEIEKELGGKGTRVLLSRMLKDGLITRPDRGRYAYLNKEGCETPETCNNQS